MKNKLFTLASLMMLGSVLAQDQEPIVNIPDLTFKAYLVFNPEINTNGDTEIQVSEAEAFTGEIDVSQKNISDLTGIEAFVNIRDSLKTSLFCGLPIFF